MVWPAIIAAGGAILGGLLARKGQKDANKQNEALQREFAQHGIAWKVADAERAGVHPLYALGGAGATYTPTAQNVMADMGQGVSRAANAAADFVGQREMQAAQLQAVRASAAKDLALAQAAESEAARLRQSQDGMGLSKADIEWYHAKGLPVPGQTQIIPLSFSEPYITPLPPLGPEVPPYLTDKVQPGFQRYNVPGIGEVILPAGSSMSESVESMENTVIQAAVIAANATHYGPEGARRLEKLMGRWHSDPIGAGIDKARDWASRHGVPIRR